MPNLLHVSGSVVMRGATVYRPCVPVVTDVWVRVSRIVETDVVETECNSTVPREEMTSSSFSYVNGQIVVTDQSGLWV